METQDRVYTCQVTGRNEDEHLEIVFHEVYHWKLSDYRAIGVILDQYTKATFGKAYVPFHYSLDRLDHAIEWAMQFGELRIFPITASDLAILREDPDLFTKVIKFGAKIGDDKAGQFRAYGATLIQVVVLAGIQVLREYSYELLNKNSDDQTH